MSWSHTRVDAHENGDCDATTCPLCELDDAELTADDVQNLADFRHKRMDLM